MLGKAVNELQRDVIIADNEVTGTLKYINGYVGFSSNVSEQSGNYLALKIDAEPVEAKAAQKDRLHSTKTETSYYLSRIRILRVLR